MKMGAIVQLSLDQQIEMVREQLDLLIARHDAFTTAMASRMDALTKAQDTMDWELRQVIDACRATNETLRSILKADEALRSIPRRDSGIQKKSRRRATP